MFYRARSLSRSATSAIIARSLAMPIGRQPLFPHSSANARLHGWGWHVLAALSEL
jgi:hypothetical protein